MANLDFILNSLSELSNKELKNVQKAVQSRLENQKHREILNEWATKDSLRAVDHLYFQTKQGWTAVIVIIYGDRQETFRGDHQDKDQSHELAAETAVQNSILISDESEPMEIW